MPTTNGSVTYNAGITAIRSLSSRGTTPARAAATARPRPGRPPAFRLPR